LIKVFAKFIHKKNEKNSHIFLMLARIGAQKLAPKNI